MNLKVEVLTLNLSTKLYDGHGSAAQAKNTKVEGSMENVGHCIYIATIYI